MRFLLIFFAILSLLRIPHHVSAHGGGLNSAGCHNCNVGSCAGTYHCHRGGGGGGTGGTTGPVILEMPKTTATTEVVPDENGTFTINFDWDRPDGKQWSIALSSVMGGDPGPKTDTTVSRYSFNDVKTGTYYVNVKEGMSNGYWSKVSYWTVKVPTWYKPIPTPTPTTMPTATKPVSTSNDTSGDGLATFLTMVGVFGGGYWLASRKNKDDSKLT